MTFADITTPVDVDELHRRLYAGEIFHFRDLAEMQALVQFTREFLERAFHPHAPPTIHLHLTREQQAQVFTALGQEFTRSPEVKSLWRKVFTRVGLSPGQLARDRLRIRFQPPLRRDQAQSKGVMHSTVPFHRDTWGTNLYAQINWWAPIFPITENRTMLLYPTLWDRPLRNTSANYDLQALVRLAAEKGRGAITGEMAVPELRDTIESAQAVPVVIETGSVIVFSSAHAHAGAPNSTELTRLSLETRTVWIPDVESGAGARNVDGAGHWMAPGFLYRVSDGRPLHEILAVQRLEPYVRGPAAASR